MDQANIRERVTSFLDTDRDLQALHVTSKAFFKAPPPSEPFMARLQKLLSVIGQLAALAVIETRNTTYAVDSGGWHQPGEFGIYDTRGCLEWSWLSRKQVLSFFVPLSGQVTRVSLKPILNGTTDRSVIGETVVTYEPPRFQLTAGEYIC